MRLVCPNCSAQYEIDGSMIPDEGRDVQCSNCGHTWFELPGPRGTESAQVAASDVGEEMSEQDEFESPAAYDIDDDDSFEEDATAPATARRETRPENLSRAEFMDDEEQPETGADDIWEDDTAEPEERRNDDERTSAAVRAVTAAAEGDEDEGEDHEDTDRDTTATGKPRRPADAAALDILREEAERELTQRRTPPSETIETQTDLGLDAIRNRRTPSRALRARMAHMGDELPEDESPEELETPAVSKPSRVSKSDDADDGYEQPRRDLLPDIDEINSTLKSSRASGDDTDVARRSGFRAGFLLMLCLVIAAIFAYAQAPAIARALPNTESAMITYVDWANGLRDRIDGLIGN